MMSAFDVSKDAQRAHGAIGRRTTKFKPLALGLIALQAET
jgi:hypothetical protein